MRLLIAILLFFFFTTIQAQPNLVLAGKSLGTLKQINQQSGKSKLFYPPTLYFSAPTSSPTSNNPSTPVNQVPLAYAYKDLALFCKLEVKMEKVVKMPVKFRLGSVDYVDWLEGKRDRYGR